MLKELYATFLKDSSYDHFLQFKHNYEKINAQLWKEYGAHKITKEELRDRRFKETLELQGIHNESLAQKMSETYIEKSPRQTVLFPNAKNCLETLKKEGYHLHIITNGFKEVQFIKLEAAGILPYFEVIVCSEMVGYNKPDKRIFHYALIEANALASESVMIGDDPEVDVLGAQLSGLQAVLFDPHKKYTKQMHQHVIRDLSEFPLKLRMI
jgi:putative hydrolase of the HAD superfamily